MESSVTAAKVEACVIVELLLMLSMKQVRDDCYEVDDDHFGGLLQGVGLILRLWLVERGRERERESVSFDCWLRLTKR